MLTIPAIDLIDGQVVRLYRGDYQQVTRFEHTPTEFAQSFASKGYSVMHVVDLAAAKDGVRTQTDTIAALVEAFGGTVQVGGGIRNPQDALELFAIGVKRVVLGTTLVKDPSAMAEWVDRFGPERVVLAADLDSRMRVATDGWTQSDLPAAKLFERASSAGIKHVLSTVIQRDGAMQGPDTEFYRRLVSDWSDFQVQASGGVRDDQDLQRLRETGVSGAIVGRAMLQGAIGQCQPAA